MAGLRRICKAYGGMKIGGVEWVWDYHMDEPIKKEGMTKERQRLSDIAKGQLIKQVWESVAKDYTGL